MLKKDLFTQNRELEVGSSLVLKFQREFGNKVASPRVHIIMNNLGENTMTLQQAYSDDNDTFTNSGAALSVEAGNVEETDCPDDATQNHEYWKLTVGGTGREKAYLQLSSTADFEVLF